MAVETPQERGKRMLRESGYANINDAKVAKAEGVFANGGAVSRAKGGGVKKGTTVNIVIGKDQPSRPVPVPVPARPMAPPMPPPGANGPPPPGMVPPGAGMPPPGTMPPPRPPMAGPMPGAMPPPGMMPHKRGGAVAKHRADGGSTGPDDFPDEEKSPSAQQVANAIARAKQMDDGKKDGGKVKVKSHWRRRGGSV